MLNATVRSPTVQLVSPFVCVPGSAPLLAQQGEVHKQISGGWNTMARSNAKQVSFKKEVGVMVIDLVFWLTVCLILKMCY